MMYKKTLEIVQGTWGKREKTTPKRKKLCNDCVDKLSLREMLFFKKRKKKEKERGIAIQDIKSPQKQEFIAEQTSKRQGAAATCEEGG